MGTSRASPRTIAKRLGYDGFSVKNVSFDALVAGKVKGFDLALSQVTITKPRAKVVGFTVPYFDSDQGILVKTGTKVDESNLKDIQWGVQGATTGQTFLKARIRPTKTPRSYTETTQAFAALQAGQVDAVLLDTSIVLQQASASDGALEVVGQLKSGEHYGGITAEGIEAPEVAQQGDHGGEGRRHAVGPRRQVPHRRVRQGPAEGPVPDAVADT